jgi:hypothetical protein
MNEVSEECLLTDGEINRFLPRPFLAENKKKDVIVCYGH